MISRIRGRLAGLSDGIVEVETAAGLTYELRVPDPLSVDLAGRESDVDIELATHQVVTESSQVLYGFASARDRSLFAVLLTGQGVGAKLALAMISTLAPHRLASALAEGDLAALSQVPGIGRKKAERIVVSLRSKVGALVEATPQAGAEAAGGISGRAVQALVGLGIPFAEAGTPRQGGSRWRRAFNRR